MYKFGCSGCDNRKQNKWYNLCDECLEKTNQEHIQKTAEELLKRAKELYDESNPSLGSDSESLKCDECDVEFESGQEIREHFKTLHPDTIVVIPSDKHPDKQSGRIRVKGKYQDGSRRTPAPNGGNT